MPEFKATTQLSTFNNNWYKTGAGKIKMLLWYCTNALFFNSYLLPISSIKISILKLFGAHCGQGIVLKPKVNIKYPWRLKIGNHVWIGEKVWIDNLENIYIEDNVCISQGAMLLCGNHNYKKSSFDLIVGKITLEKGCWVGAQTVVCPGVIVHSHAVLTVGSVATQNLEPYSIYSENPAQKIKERIIKE
jgi:putative colanic acid biosynthesis acetyltransferase WcaF